MDELCLGKYCRSYNSEKREEKGGGHGGGKNERCNGKLTSLETALYIGLL